MHDEPIPGRLREVPDARPWLEPAHTGREALSGPGRHAGHPRREAHATPAGRSLTLAWSSSTEESRPVDLHRSGDDASVRD
jgi:hypothetical protein